MAVTRNTVATYFIPSENEWYKAAFYNPTNGTYWTYETQSNTAPSNALSATGTNNANYYVSGYTDPTNHLTPVGAFASSPGPYGTFDMAGDVWQWNEADVSSAERGDRGGSWTYNSNALASFTRGYGFPAEPIHDIGFRVAANIPEPPSIALLVCGAIAVLMWHKKATLVVIHSFPVFAKSVMSPFFFPCLLAFAWWRRWASRSAPAVAAFLLLAASVAQADVFNMPSGQTSLSFVAVGDPGNAADTTGYGSVPYVYQIGKYDVTVAQYCQFLNAVAATDTYGLYNGNMAAEAYYGLPTVGIAQSGIAGDYSYSVSGSYGQGGNCPVFDVSWGDAARFCNWLDNGQPTFPAGTPGEVAGSTETGAYTLDGDTTSYAETRNAAATYFLPSENEWYKAAFYKGGNAHAGYWAYPTQSNTAPSNVLSPTGSNNANYNAGTYNSPVYTDPVNYLTPVARWPPRPDLMARLTKAATSGSGPTGWMPNWGIISAASAAGAGTPSAAPRNWLPLPTASPFRPARATTSASAWQASPNPAASCSSAPPACWPSRGGGADGWSPGFSRNCRLKAELQRGACPHLLASLR